MSPILGLTGLGGGSASPFLYTASGAAYSHQMRFKYYAYGATIGTLETYWDDGTSLNGPLTFTAETASGEIEGTSISGQQHTTTQQTWYSVTVNLSPYAGTTGKFVFYYRQGSSFTGDFQVDNMEIETPGNAITSYDPDKKRLDPNNDDWQTGLNNTVVYTSVSWTNATYTSAAGRWNYDNSGTSSGGTADTRDADGDSLGYYLYAETSSPTNLRTFWLRMKYAQSL